MPHQISLICTVKNEDLNILELVLSIFEQECLPDEIIIVDGGSTDNTKKVIQSVFSQIVPITLIEKKGTNIAQGRNIAIQNAKYPIIACTDAGCRVHPAWLREIMTVFNEKPEVKVIGGWYLPDARNNFEKVVASLIFPRLPGTDKEREKFLPSARNIAFYKTCWEEVGGFPEELDTAEDTVFDLNLKKAGYRISLLESAIVYWKVRSSYSQLYKQFYGYGKGDGEAELFIRNYLITIILYGSGFLCLVLSLLFPLLFLVPSIGIPAYIGTHIIVKNPPLNLKESILIPLILFTVDIGRMHGFSHGWLAKQFRTRVL